MALKFTTTRKSAQERGINVMVYSKSGVGKTTLAATAKDNIILSSENGLLSLGDHDIPAIEITKFADIKESYEWVASSKEAAQFQTVTLDSITDIGEMVITYYKGLYKDPRQAYGELVIKVHDTIKKFLDLSSKNIYMIAKEARFKDEVTGGFFYGPAMPGQRLPQDLPYLYDEVFHLEIGMTDSGKKYRFLRTQPDDQYDAKDRSGALDEVERPHLDHVFNKIKTRLKK